MTTAGPLIVVGDALLDCDMDGQVSRLCPDAPGPVLEDAAPMWRPGGAALAALLAATDEVPVILVAALGDDEASATVRALFEPHVTVIGLPLNGPLAEKTRFRAGGRTLLRADRAGGPAGSAGAEAAEAIAAAGAVLISDYGRGVTADERIRAALSRQAKRIPLVWDPHPRGASPVPHTRLVTPNYAEALAAAGQPAAAVRRAFPGHRVVLAAPEVLAPLVPLTCAVDELLPTGELQPIPWTGLPADLAIDLHGRGQASHRLVAALRPRRLITFGGDALGALAASARLVISGDTGMSHLASAYARPSVTLFGPVSPSEWGPPRDPRHQVLWEGAPGYRGDPHASRTDPALGAITVDAVYEAAAVSLRGSAAHGTRSAVQPRDWSNSPGFSMTKEKRP